MKRGGDEGGEDICEWEILGVASDKPQSQRFEALKFHIRPKVIVVVAATKNQLAVDEVDGLLQNRPTFMKRRGQQG